MFVPLGSNFHRVHLRPTEYPKLFSCIILKTYTHEDEVKSLMSDKEKLFDHIKTVTNRHDLQFGKMTWLSEWRFVPYIIFPARLLNLQPSGQTYEWRTSLAWGESS